MIRKRPFNLIEVSIGLFLLSLVMYALFSNLHVSAHSLLKMRKTSELEYSKTFFDMKIARLIEHLSTNTAIALIPATDTTPAALSLMHQAPLHRNKALTSHLASLLYQNEKNQLCLATYQDKQNKMVANEVLLENISTFSVLFFDPKLGTWTEQPQNIDMIKIHLAFTDQSQADFVYFIHEVVLEKVEVV